MGKEGAVPIDLEEDGRTLNYEQADTIGKLDLLER